MSLSTLLYIVHFIGLGLSVGAATVKLTLVIRCLSDRSFVPAFNKVATTITRLIVTGMILLAVSGITWIVMGYDFTGFLIVKIILFAFVFVLGPIIDNVAEPKLRKLAPDGGVPPSTEFVRAQKVHLMLEIVATLLFYVIIVMWMFR